MAQKADEPLKAAVQDARVNTERCNAALKAKEREQALLQDKRDKHLDEVPNVTVQ